MGAEEVGVEGWRGGSPIYPQCEVNRGDKLRQWMLDVCAENAGTLNPMTPSVTPTILMSTPTHTKAPL